MSENMTLLQTIRRFDAVAPADGRRDRCLAA
jgi:hypothetical protein